MTAQPFLPHEKQRPGAKTEMSRVVVFELTLSFLEVEMFISQGMELGATQKKAHVEHFKYDNMADGSLIPSSIMHLA